MNYFTGLLLGFGFSLVGSTAVRANNELTEVRKPPFSVAATDTVTDQTHQFSLRQKENKPDSLLIKRFFFVTRVMQQGDQLSRQQIKKQLAASPQSMVLYRRSQLLKPVGPILVLSGLMAGYFGIKGETKNGFVRGVRTPTQSGVPDISVSYTKRSLPLLAAGVGLLVGGFCLIEISNRLTTKSVSLYNSRVVPRRLESRI